MRRFSRLLVGALLALPLMWLAGGEVLAGSTLYGTLRGKVADEKGEPLVGVTIQVRSPELIRDVVRITDAEGNFFVPDLPQGKFTVVAQLQGYITLSIETDIQKDRTTQLPVVLKEGELSETVTVTATRPVVDKTATESAGNYDKAFTDSLPAGRSYQSLVQFAPGVTGGSNPNVLGGTSSSNQYLVDGVSTRDPVTGTFGSNVNFDAIESVEIKLTGVSAEYGEFQGGLTSVTIKSGGNEFTGSFRDVISAPRWTRLYSPASEGEFAAPVTAGQGLGFTYNRPARRTTYDPGADKETNRMSLTLGGPIVVDTAWFFMSYDRIDNRANAVLGNPTGGTSGNGTYINFFDGDIPSLKLTWQATNNHRFQYSFFEDPARTTRCYGQLFFGGDCYDSYTVDLQGQGGFSYILNWTANWSPTLTTDFKYTRFKNSFKIQPLTPIPSKPQFIFDEALGSGPAAGNGPAIEGPYDPFGAIPNDTYDANIFDETPEDRRREQWELQATKFLDTDSIGSHTIKIGADYKEQDRVGASIIQGNSLTYFYRLDALADPDDPANRAFFYMIDYAEPNTAIPINKFTALYVNDEWQLNENLAFNLGLRWEKSDNRNDVGEKIIKDDGFAPRLGVAWDVTGQGKHLVKATASRYLAGVNITTLSPFVRGAGGQSSYNFLFNANFPNPPGPSGSPTGWQTLFEVRPDPGSNLFEPGIQPQSIDEYTLGYEFQFNPTFGVGAKYVKRDWDNIITQTFDFDYVFTPPDVVTSRQIQTLGINEDAKRSYEGVILTADKRFANNWELRANYVWSKTEGNVETENGFDSFGAYDVPDATQNRYGLLSFDVKHAVKFQASYEIPLKSARHGLSVGSIFDFRAGNPWARNRTYSQIVGPGYNGTQDLPLGTECLASAPCANALTGDQVATVQHFTDPRGSTGREPNAWNLDLSAKYRFKFSKNTNFEAMFECFNVTNEQNTLVVSSTWFEAPGSAAQRRTNYTLGFPTAYGTAGTNLQTPRAYRLNFALTW
ncbi:MAG TPA: TonB-dependent receptor [Candidatus Polarisedimenticolaceae bacterium]